MGLDLMGKTPESNQKLERFGSLLDHMVEGFQVIDFDWRYHYVNEAVCRQGRRKKEELLGRKMMEVYPGIEQTPLFEVLERSMRERTSAEMENEFSYPDGTKGWFELRIQPVPDGLVILSLDIGQRKSLEAQLQQSQKMEAVGRLAGGIAHDFNNILTAVINFGQFVLETLPPGSAALGDMNEVLSAARRAEALVGQLLAFSRRRTIEPRVVDINELVTNIESMLWRILGEDIQLQTTLGKDLWNVRIDPSAFEQVFVNLAVNARDAMPTGGALTIETLNVVLDEGYRMAKGGLVESGDYVCLAVSDNGTGMDEETREQLFEPFFTTKPPGKGTGLGLSTCYGIVKQAGGCIWVYSEPESGTTFKIYLPREKAPSEQPTAPQERDMLSGTETILVVEDDPQVRKIAVRSLEQCGYRVLEARSGVEALAVLEKEAGFIALLLTDVVMPGMNGKDLSLRVTKLRPDVRVLFMSGYTENAIIHHGVLDPGVNLIQKPFTPDRLAQRVREVLDA